MAHKNQKIEKKREYNPFSTKTLKRFKIGKINGYLRAVIPNPKDVFGVRKQEGLYYSQNGYKVKSAVYGAGIYESDRVFFLRGWSE